MRYGYRLTLVGRRKADAGLIAKFGEEVVNLAGVAVTHTYAESRKAPARTVTFPAATQKHLKMYFDGGCQDIIERFEIEKKQTEKVEKPKSNKGEK